MFKKKTPNYPACRTNCMQDNICAPLRQKAERGKKTSTESATRFPRVSCFEKPTRSVPETWGPMYDVQAWIAEGTRRRYKKLDSRAAKKGTKKLVSCVFAKILPYWSGLKDRWGIRITIRKSQIISTSMYDRVQSFLFTPLITKLLHGGTRAPP